MYVTLYDISLPVEHQRPRGMKVPLCSNALKRWDEVNSKSKPEPCPGDWWVETCWLRHCSVNIQELIPMLMFFCAGNHGHGTTDRQNGAPFTSSATICNATEEKARYMHNSHAHMHTQKYIQLYVCLFVYLFTYLYLLLFIYLSDNSTIYIIIYLFCVIIYLFIHSFTYLFTYTHSE